MGEAILVFDNVSGKGRGFKLHNINLKIEPGYIYGIIGENGAGKTTLLNYVMDYSRKYTGSILMDELEVSDNRTSIMNKIGFISEDRLFLQNSSGRLNAELFGKFYEGFNMEYFKSLCKAMELSTGKNYGAMSRGEKMKFQLAFSMAYKPKLFLLDEVTAGMDPVFRIELFKILQRLIADEDVAVVMTSHIISDMEKKADYVGIMQNGKLVSFGEALEVIKEYGE